MSWTQFCKKLTSNYVKQKLQLERKLLISFSTIPIQLTLLYLTIPMKIYPEFSLSFFIGKKVILLKKIWEKEYRVFTIMNKEQHKKIKKQRNQEAILRDNRKLVKEEQSERR